MLLPYNVIRLHTEEVWSHGLRGGCRDGSGIKSIHYVKPIEYGCMEEIHKNLTEGKQVCRSKFCGKWCQGGGGGNMGLGSLQCAGGSSRVWPSYRLESARATNTGSIQCHTFKSLHSFSVWGNRIRKTLKEILMLDPSRQRS